MRCDGMRPVDLVVLDALTGYYDTLGKLGYYKYKDVFRILVLCFYKDFVYADYHGLLSREDYKEIDRALNCLFGSNCLIPYPDYLKMGKLHLGEITEMASRMKVIEDTQVLKVFTNLQTPVNNSSESDIRIEADE